MGTDFLSAIIEYKQYLISKQKHYRSESSLRNDAEKCLSHRPFIEPMADSAMENIHIIACGTSFHAGCVAKYWIESLAGVTCQVEIASEYRYRDVVVPPKTLFLTLSQSGETADTLEALRLAKSSGYVGSLTVCNSAHSSMVRESDLVMMTQAGPEIGVASTKAFTTQLLSMLIVTLILARQRGMSAEDEVELVPHVVHAAAAVEEALQMSDELTHLAEDFAEKEHTLFLGRGPMWPIAMEGALKLKEISYIHAEAYAAGELKHGPISLLDAEVPLVAVARMFVLPASCAAGISRS